MYKNCVAFEVVKKSMFGIEEQSILPIYVQTTAFQFVSSCFR